MRQTRNKIIDCEEFERLKTGEKLQNVILKKYFFDLRNDYFYHHDMEVFVLQSNGQKNCEFIILKNKQKEFVYKCDQEEFMKLLNEKALPDSIACFLKERNHPVALKYNGFMLSEVSNYGDYLLKKNEYLATVDYERYENNPLDWISELATVDHDDYERFRIALKVKHTIRTQVSCVPFHEDQLLLISKVQSNSSEHMKFIPAGGHVEFNELLEDAVKREMMEETGIMVSQLSLCGIVTFYGVYNYHSICFFYKGIADNKTIQIREKNIEAKWFQVEKINEIENMSEYHRMILKYIVHDQFFDMKIQYTSEGIEWSVSNPLRSEIHS